MLSFTSGELEESGGPSNDFSGHGKIVHEVQHSAGELDDGGKPLGVLQIVV
jgi:hypothetical protein